jgi:hypothetical protein
MLTFAWIEINGKLWPELWPEPFLRCCEEHPSVLKTVVAKHVVEETGDDWWLGLSLDQLAERYPPPETSHGPATAFGCLERDQPPRLR